MNIGNISSWTLSVEQANLKLDFTRGTFNVVPNARQESKLLLKFASVDTDELRDLEIRVSGDLA
jgi:hypothetical protein